MRGLGYASSRLQTLIEVNPDRFRSQLELRHSDIGSRLRDPLLQTTATPPPCLTSDTVKRLRTLDTAAAVCSPPLLVPVSPSGSPSSLHHPWNSTRPNLSDLRHRLNSPAPLSFHSPSNSLTTRSMPESDISRRSRDPLYLYSQHSTTLEQLELNGGLNLIVRPGRFWSVHPSVVPHCIPRGLQGPSVCAILRWSVNPESTEEESDD